LWGHKILPKTCWSPWTASVPNKNLILYFVPSLVVTLTPKSLNLSISFFQFYVVCFMYASLTLSTSNSDGILARLPSVVGAAFPFINSEPKAKSRAYCGSVLYLSSFVMA
jgi:hypothetical protein